ncbi:MAG: type IV secretion system protein [Acidiphilium sp.]|nr:type IV secretion system protein [Acidiphilium sp.]
MTSINGLNTFTALYSIFTTSVLDPIQALTSDVLAAANLPLELLLVVMLTVIGIGMVLGRTTADGVVNRLIRMAIVVSLVAQSGVYFHYVQDFFLTGLPSFFNTHIISTFTGQYGASQASPGSGFDKALKVILADSKIITKTAPTGINGIVPRIEIVLGETIALAALAFLFAVFIIVQTLLGIVIILGPIMILGYLFDYTKRYTDGWLSALITLSILTLVVDIVVLVLVSTINMIFSDIALTTNFSQNLEAWLGGLAGIVVITAAVAVLPRVIEAIGGGVALGLGLENSSRWLRGTPLFRPDSGLGRSSGRGGAAGGNARPSATSRIINRIRNRNKGNS